MSLLNLMWQTVWVVAVLVSVSGQSTQCSPIPPRSHSVGFQGDRGGRQERIPKEGMRVSSSQTVLPQAHLSARGDEPIYHSAPGHRGMRSPTYAPFQEDAHGYAPWALDMANDDRYCMYRPLARSTPKARSLASLHPASTNPDQPLCCAARACQRNPIQPSPPKPTRAHSKRSCCVCC
jgi:hypothetical protein